MYVGLDVHKKYCYATVLNEDGVKVTEGRFLNTLEELDQFLTQLDEDTQVAMEASAAWEPLYEHLESKGFVVSLAHPLKTRAIAEAKIKTDRIDSRILAQLLRADLLPQSYIPAKAIRDLRSIVRHRASLVRIRIQVKNMIHALLAKERIHHSFSDLFGKAGTVFLRQVKLSELHQFALENYMAVLDILEERIKRTAELLEKWGKQMKEVAILTSIPGIGIYSAMLILGEVGEIERFPNGKKLCSYAGLVPRVHQSGGTERYGKITKEGSKWLRWILIQAAHTTVRTANALQRFYHRLKRRKGEKVAIVATARKMLLYIYQMLKWEVRFEELKVNQARVPR